MPTPPDPRQVLPPWMDTGPAPYALRRGVRPLQDPPGRRLRAALFAVLWLLTGLVLGALAFALL